MNTSQPLRKRNKKQSIGERTALKPKSLIYLEAQMQIKKFTGKTLKAKRTIFMVEAHLEHKIEGIITRNIINTLYDLFYENFQ